MRKLFRLVQLEEIAERIMQEGLVPDARDERDPVHLDALVLQVGDRGIDVVDSDREVVRTGRLGIGFHQMHLLAAGIEPAPWAKIGARQLRHAEHVAIEGETLLRVGDADGDVVHTGRLHRLILTRIPHSRMKFGTCRVSFPGEAVLMGVAPDSPVSVRMHRPISPPASEGPRYGNWGLSDEATRA